MLCLDCMITQSKQPDLKRITLTRRWLFLMLISCLLIVPGFLLGTAMTGNDLFESRHRRMPMLLDGPFMLLTVMVWLIVLMILIF
jgi:hypothetical protein